VWKLRGQLAQFTQIVQIVPQFDGRTDNAYQNLYWMELMTAAGLHVQRIDWPGGHTAFPAERFVALEEALLPSLAH
jgi:hypothetical protein